MSKRTIRIEDDGLFGSFECELVTRADLYGTKRELRLDTFGRECKQAQLTGDGVLLRKGMTGRTKSVAVDEDGNPLDVLPSTLDEVQQAVMADPVELLLARIMSVHRLIPFDDIDGEVLDNLNVGTIYRIPYRYRPSAETKTAWIIANEQGLFALIGRPTEPGWSSDLDVMTDDEPEPFKFGGIL